MNKLSWKEFLKRNCEAPKTSISDSVLLTTSYISLSSFRFWTSAATFSFVYFFLFSSFVLSFCLITYLMHLCINYLNIINVKNKNFNGNIQPLVTVTIWHITIFAWITVLHTPKITLRTAKYFLFVSHRHFDYVQQLVFWALWGH